MIQCDKRMVENVPIGLRGRMPTGYWSKQPPGLLQVGTSCSGNGCSRIKILTYGIKEEKLLDIFIVSGHFSLN